ncbi:(Fe-S)-binding protein [Pseudonocardia benzenivorans]
MREFKAIWDPDAKMNPGKVVDAYRMDENLKLGTDYNPWRPEVRFAYPQDDGDFAHAALRCVGVGKCRDPEPAQTMCPSYQVTREEKHTTRGRSRLLFEMLRGEVITDGWQSKEVADGLELCLACKGCTSDCPVDVDMPTYKAEFRYHHYKSWRRRRNRHAYAFGFIDQVARLASRMPELVNLVTRTPGLAHVAKLAAGIDLRRPLPRSRRRRCSSGSPSAAAPGTRTGVGWCCSRTPSPTICTPMSGSPAWRRSRPPAGGSSCRRCTCAAGARSTTTGSSTWPTATCAASSTCSATTSGPARPSSGWNPAVWPSSRTSCSRCSRTTTTRGASPGTPTTSASSSPASTSTRPTWTGRRCCGGTATSARPAASTPTGRSWNAWG